MTISLAHLEYQAEKRHSAHRENVTRLSWDLSPGPLVSITSDTECQNCTMGALVVSPGSLAMYS